MPARARIVICHCPADETWAALFQSTAGDAARTGEVQFHDGATVNMARKRGRVMVADFAEALRQAECVWVLASEQFMASPLFMALRPVLGKNAAENGPVVRVVPVSYCLHEFSWLGKFPVNWDAQPLDSLSPSRREQVATSLLAAGLNGRASAQERITVEDPPRPREEADEKLRAHYQEQLSGLIEVQKQQHRWQRLLGGGLWIFAALALAAALAVFFQTRRLSEALIVAGFALFVATMAIALGAQRRCTGQRLITTQYLRAGFVDATVPMRQRDALAKKADLGLASHAKA